jgi:hypothetical protein
LKLAGIQVGNSSTGTATTDDAIGTTNEPEEFTYVPDTQQTNNDETENVEKTKKEAKESAEKEATNNTTLPFANDGSFLEQMKKRLAAESNNGTNGNGEEDDDDGPPKKRQET